MARIKDGSLILLQRGHEDTYGTHGVLIYAGRYVCFTLEEPWRNNERKVSCIPAGTYRATKFKSPSKGDVFLLHGVPGRSMIEIHVGNDLKDTEGCILVGLQRIKSGVAQSKDAMKMLLETLPETFFLEVK
jgi:hypothetical protein